METLDAIFSRRSIRRYTEEPVTDEQIKTLLHAAMMAPSAYDGQPWHFIVVRERDSLNEITEHHPYSKMLREAPVCIVVCADVKNVRIENYWYQDCAAATENILLAAADMGLGTCWMGVAPFVERMEPVKRQFNIRDGFEPFCLIAVGHPAETRPTPERFVPECVHYETW